MISKNDNFAEQNYLSSNVSKDVSNLTIKTVICPL